MAKVAGSDLSSLHSVPEIRQDTRDPTEADDQLQSFTLGDEWYNTETGAVFKCIDSSEGGAVWTQFIAPAARRAAATQQRAEHGAQRSVPRHTEVTRPE
jgi:hypothetical protein